MQGCEQRVHGDSLSQELFLFGQLLLSSIVLLTLSAVGVTSLSVYILVLYAVSAVAAEIQLSAKTMAGWQRRVWRVIQGVGVAVGAVLVTELIQLVRNSGVLT
jgi:hypothetical protein